MNRDAHGHGTILHVDMDAFYAAIEQLDNPDLRGKPVVVGAPPDKRGVVATASYEARRYGIASAMPSRTAHKLCPDAIFVPVRMKRYAEVSRGLMDVLNTYTPLVEKISVDEAFLDVGGAMRLWSDSVALARDLKAALVREIHLTASIGVAPNKFLAKLASDMNKPDGLTTVPVEPEAIRTFLAPMDISRIWGVGKATAEKLRGAGLHSIGHLQKQSEARLQGIVGRSLAAHIHRLARGLDDRLIATESVEKSISNEHTFSVDCTDMRAVERRLRELAENVGRRLRAGQKHAKTVQIKIRRANFDTLTRQTALTPPANADRALLEAAVALWQREELDEPIRLIGFGVSGLVDPASTDMPETLELFPEFDGTKSTERDARLDQAVDRLREQFGRDSVRRRGG